MIRYSDTILDIHEVCSVLLKFSFTQNHKADLDEFSCSHFLAPPHSNHVKLRALKLNYVMMTREL